MNAFQPFALSKMQLDIIEELLGFVTAEERLNWIFERTPIVPALTKSDCTEGGKIQGCQSGLWINGTTSEGLCFFRAYSDSKMVHGIASLLCDLYSSRSTEEIRAMNSSFIAMLGLEGLLTITRKRAVASIFTYIQTYAELRSAYRSPVTVSAVSSERSDALR